jgi:hypothetical protein
VKILPAQEAAIYGLGITGVIATVGIIILAMFRDSIPCELGNIAALCLGGAAGLVGRTHPTAPPRPLTEPTSEETDERPL